MPAQGSQAHLSPQRHGLDMLNLELQVRDQLGGVAILTVM